MKTAVFVLVWLMTVLAAAYDGRFAWQYRDELLAWELNPVATITASTVGVGAILLFKSATLGFALGLAVYCHARHLRLELPLTWIIGGAYLLLSLYYLFGQLHGPGAYGIPPDRLAAVTAHVTSGPTHP